MTETKKNTVIVSDNILAEINIMVPMEYRNMSSFVVDTMRFYIEEEKKLEVIEKLKIGYIAMSKLNLRLAEIGLEQDVIDLAIYEANLKRCEIL